MNLVLDIGNTRVKSAVFKGRELLQNDSFPFDISTLAKKVSEHTGPIIISSVKNLEEENFLKSSPNLIFLSPSIKLPLKNSYQTPETLGNDRLSNAVAIHKLSNKENTLAIDCGTCLKFDFVQKGYYLGGSISPGLEMRLKALNTFTDKLPLIKAVPFERLNGMNTQESILSGCYRGMLAEINQTIADYESQFGQMDIYLTGGDHLFFANHLKNRIFADPFLTLKGLNEILLFQNT